MMISTGCSKDPEAARIAAMDQTFAELSKCAPTNESAADINLAVVSVVNEPNETQVRLVAYPVNSPAEFKLPVYRLSSGRWLIGEGGRAYLVDEKCREYKLRDRRASQGQAFPPDGVIRLNPGQAFEMTLSFNRLSERSKLGMLIYEGRKIPFIASHSINRSGPEQFN